MIRVGIIGATGYTGEELVRILSNHPHCEITLLTANSNAGERISNIYPSLAGVCDLFCEKLDVKDAARRCDVVFTALPHGASKSVIPPLLDAGLRVIDMSGDFRYNDVSVYEKWYGVTHDAPELLKESVYGLCELHRSEIKQARLVGNPGCYTTCSILGLVPLVANKMIDNKSIIIDAKSGVTGAGRSEKIFYNFNEVNENMRAYKIGTHRHTSEIEQELSIVAGEKIALSFTPHLAPMKRGIFATVYANLSKKATGEELVKMYREYYRGEQFIRVMDSGKTPESKYVNGSNFVDIGIVVDERLNRVIVVSVLDNLVKGASGQAVQNMNIMFTLPEETGLKINPLYL